jgi:hypothetical protein
MRGVVWFGLLAMGCIGETEPEKGDTEEPEEESCAPEEGTWTLAWTQEEGSDPECPVLEESEFVHSEDEETTPSCDEGCDCQFEVDEEACTANLSESCADTEISCTFEMEDSAHMSGECSIVVTVGSTSVTCSYTIDATHGS